MSLPCSLLCVALTAMVSCAAGAAPLPEVTLGKVIDEKAGGSLTDAMTAELDGKKVFVKSNRGNARGTRYANLEADVLAGSIFQRLGMRCPKARIVGLSKESTCRDRLGTVVQVMEFVNAEFAGAKVFSGFWPTRELADTDAFIKVALVDIIIGNGDRRDPNYFVSVPHSGASLLHTPIPIDNNAGFGTMINWIQSNEQMNFVKTYGGPGVDGAPSPLGTIANIVRNSSLARPVLGLPELRARVLELEAEVRARLDDAFWSAAVSLLPAEMIPADMQTDFTQGLPDAHARIVAARRAELREVFSWRRDNLRAALEKYFEWRRNDPEQQKLDREIR